MHPFLSPLPGWEIPCYGLALSLGLALAGCLLLFLGERQGHPRALLLNLCAGMGLAGFLGGKLQAGLEQGVDGLSRSGLGSQGALAGAAVAALLLLRRRGVGGLAALDLVGPPALLAAALARLGCFLAGCCYGTPSGAAWAVLYPAGHPAAGEPTHPVQLYESALLLGALAMTMRGARGPAGTVGWLSLGLYSGARLVVEPFREPSPEGWLTAGLDG